MQHDPAFESYKEIMDQKPTALESYLIRSKYGMDGYPASDNMARMYQMHLNVERIRVPECLFQPSICGVDTMGITELIEYLTLGQQLPSLDVARNIFLTGSHMKFPGLEDRIRTSLQSIVDPEQKVQVQTAQDASLDAWYGGALLARSAQEKIWISKADYYEYGAEYFVEHRCSNIRYAN